MSIKPKTGELFQRSTNQGISYFHALWQFFLRCIIHEKGQDKRFETLKHRET